MISRLTEKHEGKKLLGMLGGAYAGAKAASAATNKYGKPQTGIEGMSRDIRNSSLGALAGGFAGYQGGKKIGKVMDAKCRKKRKKACGKISKSKRKDCYKSVKC